MKKLSAVLLSLVMVASLFTGVAFASSFTAVLNASVAGTIALNQSVTISGSLLYIGTAPSDHGLALQHQAPGTTTWTALDFDPATTGTQNIALSGAGTFLFPWQFTQAGAYRIAFVATASPDVALNAQGGTPTSAAPAVLVHNIGTIATQALTVTPGVTSVVRALDNTVNVPLTVTRALEGLAWGHLQTVTVNYAGTDIAAVQVVENDPATVHPNLALSITLPTSPATGTLTLTVRTNDGNWVGTATVTVAPREAFNAVLTPGVATVGTPVTFEVAAFNAAGNGPGTTAGTHTFAYFRATLSGPFAAPTPIVGTSLSAEFTSVTPRHQGIVTATVVFYDAAHNVLHTIVREITVAGVRVEVPVTTIRRNDDTTLRVIVTDAAGNRINNARVTFVGSVPNMFFTRNAAGVLDVTPVLPALQNPASLNATVNTSHPQINGMLATQPRGSAVTNGEYSIDVRVRERGTVGVIVEIPTFDGTNIIWTQRANWPAAITAAATLGYTVTLDHTLLAGTTTTENVMVTVRDSAGVAVTTGLHFVGSTGLTVGAPTHTGLGVWSVPMHVAAAAGTFTLTVNNDATAANATITGTASITAVAPVVTVTPAGGLLTSNFYSVITVNVTDPRTNVAVAREITVAPRAVTTPDRTPHPTATIALIQNRAVATPVPAWAGAGTVTASSREFNILAHSAALTVAGTAETPNVRVTVAGAPAVDLGFGEATFVVTPAQLVAGRATAITVRLNDANGVAMRRQVVFSGRLSGTIPVADIPVDGTLSFGANVTIPTEGILVTPQVTLTVQPDRAGATAPTHNIPVVAAPVAPADTAAPIIEVTVPAVTTEATAVVTVTVRDNVNLAANGVIFDGAVVPGFVTREQVFTRVVNLREGMNIFTVAAQDAAGNVATRTIAVERRTPPAPVSHVITIGRANPAIGLDVPANVRNGRLMVPFRWFGERILEATVDYRVVGTAEIVTLVKGNISVELTLNSTIAKVNGTPVSLDVAAFATGGRTLVPARFLAETFGYTVNWNPADDSVTITKR